MFERFTDRARRVVVWAQEEARLLNHNYIGSEHLLLGLAHDSGGVAAQALASLGVSLEAARAQVMLFDGRGNEEPSGHVPFTLHARHALERSVAATHRLGSDRIGPEHLILGLLDVEESTGVQVLSALGVAPETVRARVLELSPPPPQPTWEDSALTPRARQVLEIAMREAMQSGRRRIGTADLLLGLISQSDSPAARALGLLGVDADSVWRAIAHVQAEMPDATEDSG